MQQNTTNSVNIHTCTCDMYKRIFSSVWPNMYLLNFVLVKQIGHRKREDVGDCGHMGFAVHYKSLHIGKLMQHCFAASPYDIQHMQ